MKSYIAHFVNDKDINLFLYENNSYISEEIIDLTDIKTYVHANANLIIFVPSNIINTYPFTDDNINEDFVVSQFINENESAILHEISSLSFRFHKNIIYSYNQDFFNNLNNIVNDIDAEILIYPEHNLCKTIVNESVIKINDNFVFTFENGTGFSTNNKELLDFFHIAKNAYPNFNPIVDLAINEEIDSYQLKKQEFNIQDMHIDFITLDKTSLLNLFKRQYSFQTIIHKTKFSKPQLIMSTLLFLFISFFPIIHSYVVDKRIKTFEDKTIELFKVLNPSFNNLIEPKAQIDSILKNLDIALSNSRSDDLFDISLLDKISTDGISSISYNKAENTIEVKLSKLSQIKYEILNEILSRFELSKISDSLVTENKAVSGVVAYTINAN